MAFEGQAVEPLPGAGQGRHGRRGIEGDGVGGLAGVQRNIFGGQIGDAGPVFERLLQGLRRGCGRGI
jgi:hypothetical protein